MPLLMRLLFKSKLVGVRERGKESRRGAFIAELVRIWDDKSLDVPFKDSFGGFGGNLDVFGGNGGRRPAIFSPFSLLIDALGLVGIRRDRTTGTLATSPNSGFENPPINCDSECGIFFNMLKKTNQITMKCSLFDLRNATNLKFCNTNF